MLIRTCCYCKKFMGIKRSEKIFGGTTHGICKKCLSIQLKKAKELKEKLMQIIENEITTKDGLLWQNGEIIHLPRADIEAQKRGFYCAELLVKHLENQRK